MKPIFRGSAIASCIVGAVWMVFFAPTLHSLANAQSVVYYSGYGQGAYGKNVPTYIGPYLYVPNDQYKGYGWGPYANDPAYANNPGNYQPSYGQTFRSPVYRVTPFGNFYRGF